MIQPGVILGDRYEIIELIGTGGMADVYKAKCHKLNRYVAIKVLKAEYSSNKNFVSKFKVEAQSAAGLMHPNIVNVYDVGEEEDLYYFVMELVEGITLKNYIEKKIHLSVKEAISIALQVSMGIEAAHNNGIIHRDIKPQNIIISKEGKVKVADFGIARAATSDTITSHAMGSVHYTSPEQARGGYSDAKSDIYSIGITLFEMVTGRVPFDGETTVAIAIKHIQDEMPSPRQYVPEIPISLEQIIFKCTQKNPDRRYSNMGELIHDLKHALISPDDNFVVINDAASNQGTKAISDDDRENLRQQMNKDAYLAGNYSKPQNPYEQNYHEQPAYEQNPYEQEQAYPPQGFENDADFEEQDYFSPRKNQHQDGRHAYAQEENKRGRASRGHQIEEEDYRDDYRNRYDDDFEDEDDVDPKMERIMTILLIVAGVVIAVAAIYFIGGKVLHLFDKTSGETQVEAESGEVVVPELVGRTMKEAEKLLQDAGLTASAKREVSNKYEKDVIISQNPAAGETVQEGTQLEIVISSGKAEGVAVPDVVGKSEAEAKVILDGEGFNMQVEAADNPSLAQGVVVSQSPLGATTASKGSTITVYVNGGSVMAGVVDTGNTNTDNSKIKVPDLVGKDETTAKSMLTTAGLNWGTISEEHNASVNAGLVLSQSYAPDTEVTQGTLIDFVVSLGASTYSCNTTVEAPADYFIGTEAVITVSDLTNAEVGRFTTTSFPYTVVQNGISTELGYIKINYQGVDEQFHETSPVAIAFTQE